MVFAHRPGEERKNRQGVFETTAHGRNIRERPRRTLLEGSKESVRKIGGRWDELK